MFWWLPLSVGRDVTDMVIKVMKMLVQIVLMNLVKALVMMLSDTVWYQKHNHKHLYTTNLQQKCQEELVWKSYFRSLLLKSYLKLLLSSGTALLPPCTKLYCWQLQKTSIVAKIAARRGPGRMMTIVKEERKFEDALCLTSEPKLKSGTTVSQITEPIVHTKLKRTLFTMSLQNVIFYLEKVSIRQVLEWIFVIINDDFYIVIY